MKITFAAAIDTGTFRVKGGGDALPYTVDIVVVSATALARKACTERLQRSLLETFVYRVSCTWYLSCTFYLAPAPRTCISHLALAPARTLYCVLVSCNWFWFLYCVPLRDPRGSCLIHLSPLKPTYATSKSFGGVSLGI